MMFLRLVQKEFHHLLLDLRFIVVFALCILLSALSAYVGSRNYAHQLQQYNIVSQKNRTSIQEPLENGNLSALMRSEYRWNRRPEVLSAVVYGLSGTLGQEVRVPYRRHFIFEASLFATDPIHALFGILDLAFVVKVIFSLCVLLFTYDTICGEKETGTLRLYVSFPVPRSTLALAKLTGPTVAIMVPFIFAFLLSALVLSISPGLNLSGEDWGRLIVLAGLFALYLIVFAAFGIFISALTHRRITAFLGLLGLWTLWLFVLPTLAVDASRRMAPVTNIYELERQHSALRSDIRKDRDPEINAYWRDNYPENTRWEDIPLPQQRTLAEGAQKIHTRWDTEFYARLRNIETGYHNQVRGQQNLAKALSALSPLGTTSFVTMDLARTGLAAQKRVEDALNVHIDYVADFIHKKDAQPWQTRTLTDFVIFTYQDTETLDECLARNSLLILNLTALIVLGFAGAYVATLRYDVR